MQQLKQSSNSYFRLLSNLQPSHLQANINTKLIPKDHPNWYLTTIKTRSHYSQVSRQGQPIKRQNQSQYVGSYFNYQQIQLLKREKSSWFLSQPQVTASHVEEELMVSRMIINQSFLIIFTPFVVAILSPKSGHLKLLLRWRISLIWEDFLFLGAQFQALFNGRFALHLLFSRVFTVI